MINYITISNWSLYHHNHNHIGFIYFDLIYVLVLNPLYYIYANIIHIHHFFSGHSVAQPCEQAASQGECEGLVKLWGFPARWSMENPSWMAWGAPMTSESSTFLIFGYFQWNHPAMIPKSMETPCEQWLINSGAVGGYTHQYGSQPVYLGVQFKW
jgi:hypothetical protein